MYSTVNNDRTISILSIKEIIGVVIVFSFVLYLLFPKGDIEQIIVEKSENTNLSINYLESMLLYYPDNVQLQMTLVKNYHYQGEVDKAIELNNKIIATNSKQNLFDELYKTAYLLLKEKYFRETNKEHKYQLKKETEESLTHYFKHMKNHRNHLFFLSEAIQMDIPTLEYSSLKELAKEQPKLMNAQLEERGFYLALSLKYKEEAYLFLERLLHYDQLKKNLKNDMISMLINHQAYAKASEIAEKIFLESTKPEEQLSFFHLAFYALLQNKNTTNEMIKKLLSEYQNLNSFETIDIKIILYTFLDKNNLTASNEFIQSIFITHQNKFDDSALALALKSFLYTSELSFAQKISSFAYKKFPTKHWLDQNIQIATWLGDSPSIISLHEDGYKYFHDNKYEKYLLEHCSLDDGYQILGEIYHKKVKHGDDRFIKKVAEYYEYIGDIENAEKYFLKLLSKHKNKEILKESILFSYRNSHFKQGIKLYEEYIEKYKIDAPLQQLTIDKLLTIKAFKKAQRFAQELETFKTENITHKKEFYQQLVDLSWFGKKYNYLYQFLWKKESNNQLPTTDYEKLITLERALNQSKRITYLYNKSWEKTNNRAYLFALFYQHIEDKNFLKLQKLIDNQSESTKKILNKNIQYQIILANQYIETSQLERASNSFKNALKLEPYNHQTHQAYLWFLIDNKQIKELSSEILFLRKNPKLQYKTAFPSVVAAMLLEKNELALNWSKKLLETDKKNPEYKELYENLLEKENQDFYAWSPKNYISSKYTHLSKEISAIETKVSHELNLFHNIDAKISLTQYQYEENKKIKDNSLAFTLKNHDEKLLWNIKLEKHNGENNFLSASINSQYFFDTASLTVDAKYQNKTNQTPELEVDGMMNSLTLKLNKPLTERINLELSYQENHYQHQDKTKLGESKHLQATSNYILRLGYPDIRVTGYLNYNQYDFIKNTEQTPLNFSELGTEFSIGANSQQTLHSGWRPFATLGLSINNKKNMGHHVALGVSANVKRNDILNLLLNYSDGIGAIHNPLYGASIDYRF